MQPSDFVVPQLITHGLRLSRTHLTAHQFAVMIPISQLLCSAAKSLNGIISPVLEE